MTALPPPPEPPETDSSGAPDIVRGRCMGRYHLLSVLGEGGMGSVYRAYDPALERGIALKVIRVDAIQHTASSADHLKTRLLREARGLARIDHPNVVSVFDVGIADDDNVFLAMELVAGQTLAATQHRKQRELDRILSWYGGAGRGLAAAHEAGLIHRDFKPDNVLVGSDRRVRVLDFGLVGAIRDAADEGESTGPTSTLSFDHVSTGQLTQAGSLMGTPRYMAPEQLRGRACGPHTDQFAFCLALTEALCGVHPFHGHSLAGRLRQIESGVNHWPRHVPKRLQQILQRGLEVDPTRRWSSMAELLDRLEALREQLQRPQRARSAVISGAVVLLAAGYSTWASEEAIDLHERCIARVDRRVQQLEAGLGTLADPAMPGHSSLLGDGEQESAGLDRARAWLTTWRDAYAQTCPAPQSSPTPGPSSADLELTRMCLDERAGEMSAIVGVGVGNDGRGPGRLNRALFEHLGHPEDCLDVSKVLIMTPTSADPQLRPHIHQIREKLAALEIEVWAGKHTKVQQGLDAIRESLDAIDFGALNAEFLEVQALLEWITGRLEASLRTHERAFEEAIASNHAWVAAWEMANILSIEGYYLGRRHRVGELESHAAALTEAAGNPDAHASMLNHIRGTLLMRDGDARASLPYFLAAMEQALRAHGTIASITSAAHGDLLVAYLQLGRAHDALPHARAQLEIAEKLHGDGHLSWDYALVTLAAVLRNCGEYEEASAVLERSHNPCRDGMDRLQVCYHHTIAHFGLLVDTGAYAQTIDSSSLSSATELTHHQVLWQAGYHAQARAALGQRELARAHLDAHVPSRSQLELLPEAWTSPWLLSRARAEYAVGRPERALEWIEKAERANLPQPSPTIRAATLALRAQLYLDKGRHGHALRLLEESAQTRLDPWRESALHHQRARALAGLGEFQLACDAAVRGMAKLEQSQGIEHGQAADLQRALSKYCENWLSP